MYPQTMINVRLDGTDRPAADICNDDTVQAAVKAVEEKLGEDGRVLLRASGTEPLIRVMVEGIDDKLVAAYSQEIADVVSKNISGASSPQVVIMGGDNGSANEVMKVFGAERALELVRKMEVARK